MSAREINCQSQENDRFLKLQIFAALFLILHKQKRAESFIRHTTDKEQYHIPVIRLHEASAYLGLRLGLVFWSANQTDLRLSRYRQGRYSFPFLNIYPYYLVVKSPNNRVSRLQNTSETCATSAENDILPNERKLSQAQIYTTAIKTDFLLTRDFSWKSKKQGLKGLDKGNILIQSIPGYN